MRTNAKRALLCLLAVVLLTGPAGALAQAAVELPELDARFYLEDEQTLAITRENLADQEASLRALGLTVATVREVMQHEEAFLLLFAPDGSQLVLRVDDKPAGLAADSVWALMLPEREAFAAALAAEEHFATVAWPEDANGFALLTHLSPETDALDAAAVATLYRGRVYTLRTDVIGRRVTEVDEQRLLAAARSFLRLGPSAVAGDAAAAPALPTQPELDATPAEVRQLATEIPLALNPVACRSATTTVAISGTTAPKAALRYTVQGVASDRFYADAEGRFAVVVKGLAGNAENLVELSAAKDKQTAKVDFSVVVDWQNTPLTLSRTGGAAEGDKLLLYGRTLPGAKVWLLRKSRTIDLNVQKDGSFTCRITLNENGGTSFTIRALAEGYHRTDLPVRLSRLVTDEREVKRLERSLADVRYDKLTQKPERYAEKLVKCSGTIVALGQANGEPCFLLRTASGEEYLLQCASLAELQLEQPLEVLATIAGMNQAFTSPWATGTYPLLQETYRYAQ